MKKVLHILASDRFSGAENVVCQIVNMYKKDEEYEMAYCSPIGPIRENLKEKNIKYIGISKMSVKEVRKIINEYKPDIIHAHDIKASIIAAITCGKLNVISHIHGNHDNMKIVSLKSIAYLLSSFKFNHILWVCDSSLKGYKYNKYINKKSKILYNVINSNEILKKIDEDKSEYMYDCIFLGRLCEVKDPKRLIDVFNGVINQFPKTRCAIVGDGELTKEVSDYIKSLGLSENIDLLGFKNNPFKVLSESKVMVMTSKYEGTPMCGLEAMILGVPIVSTPTDGLIELVDNGETGFLGYNNEELIMSISSIISNRELRSKLSNNSRKKATKINDLDEYKKILNNIYV